MSKKKQYPPLIQMVLDVQARHPSAIVATEIGAFYEIHEIDGVGFAREASQILDTVLTWRDKSDPSSPRMTGFPSHTADNHFKKLVQAGKTVVVVSQAVRGTKADGNKKVQREITQILSPGTVVENISHDRSNFFAALYFQESAVGVALIDVSTGEVLLTEMNVDELANFLEVKSPAEILIVGDVGNFVLQKKEHQLIHNVTDSVNKLSSSGAILSAVYSLPNPTSNATAVLIHLGIEMWRLGTLALANLLNYLTEYNKLLLKKVGYPTVYNLRDHLTLPPNAFLSLDVFTTQTEKEDSQDTFIGVIDRCKTAMGKRKLRQWVQGPLTDLDAINLRLDSVEEMIKSNNFLPELKMIYDFARLSRKMALARLLPHEIVNFYESLKVSEFVLGNQKLDALKEEASEICQFIDERIVIEEARGLSELTLSFFAERLDQELDSIHEKWQKEASSLERLKAEFEAKLSAQGKLKINEKLESYTLNGPKSLAVVAKEKKVPVQAKASEIQICDEKWDETSKLCLHYKNQFLKKANDVWSTFQREFIDQYGERIIAVGEKIAELDVLSSFAIISSERNYHRPKLVSSDQAYISFKALRHPVVEISKKLSEGFVSNDVVLGDDKKTLVIYGANSAGKSTILKSVALNIVMAQMGCFIAAAEGSELSVFDAVLTRMASFDSLTEGLSTFTLEMYELQSALKYREKKAVFLFDEIGRGTSVEDGEAIAYGTLVHLDDAKTKAITLFATHYHGLVPSLRDLASVSIKSVSCTTGDKGELIFARKLEDGPGNGSYGIKVAQSCGIPESIIRAASRYGTNLHKHKTSRYNSAIEGSLCELCHERPFQETHHLEEQKQGKVKKFYKNGDVRNINDKSNLAMLCGACHRLVTNGEIEITRKVKTSENFYLLEFKPVSSR